MNPTVLHDRLEKNLLRAPRANRPMSTPTFAEVYCRRHALPPERFERAVLARALYPHARVLAPFIRLLWPEHFAADLDLVRNTGQLCRVRDFSVEAAEFAYHPANHPGLRQILRLRVSVQRLRHLVQATLHAPPSAPSALAGDPFSPSEPGRPADAPGNP